MLTYLQNNKWIIWLLLVAPVLFIYYQVGSYGYLTFDDSVYFTENPYINKGLTLESLRWAFTTHYADYWGPVTWISFLSEAQLFGKQAVVSHGINIILHISNTVLLFILLKRSTQAFWQSFSAALLFGIHPLHVESVAWITERKDMLSTFFGLASLLAYTYYVENTSAKKYILVAILFVLAICSKPSMVMLPVMMFILDYWPLKRIGRHSLKKRVVEKIPFVIGALLVALITSQTQRGLLLANDAHFYSSLSQVEYVIIDYGNYLIKLVIPAKLTVFYPRTLVPSLTNAAITILLLSFISFYSFTKRHNKPYLITGLLWYVLVLLPMSGLIVFGRNVMADRFSYVPSIGIFIMVTWWISDIRWTKKYLCLFLLIVSVVMTAVSYHQASYWKNDKILFQHAIDVTNDNYIAYNNMGNEYINEQDYATAITFLERANNIMPDHNEILNNLGVTYEMTHQTEKAEAIFQKAITLYPNYDKPYVNLATVLTRQNRYEDAIALYQKAVDLNSANEKALNNLGALYLLTKQYSLSIKTLQKSLLLSPNNSAILYNLGYAYFAEKDYEQATIVLQKAFNLDPKNSNIKQLLDAVRANTN